MSNDRLKFRAWHKYVDVMVYWGDSAESGEGDVFPFYPAASDCQLGEAIADPLIEVMQWTGLYNSEGVEIYEGDRVSLWYAPGARAKGWISFENGGFYFKTPEAYPEACLAHDCVYEHGNYFRVIGNKYEHPDLAGATPKP